MPDIQDAKCFEFTIQILLPPPPKNYKEGDKFARPSYGNRKMIL